MTTVIGVRFKKTGKIYYFDPKGIEFVLGDGAIVETARGVEYGDVVIANREVDDKDIAKALKKVLRKADERDISKVEGNREREKKAYQVCEEKIVAHKLEMKLINVEYTFDGSKIVFYFTAEGRVDFRELVKDLASIFRTRIELRQIGVRDETKMIGGLGPCGRPACCALFLGDFQPVSIRMAKEQSLSLSPSKISGLCGRLMCCLNYEHEYYKELQSLLPRVNSEVQTPDGKGSVLSTNALRQMVRVKVITGEDDFDVKEYPISEITVLSKRRRPPERRQSDRKQSERKPERRSGRSGGRRGKGEGNEQRAKTDKK